MVDLMVGFGVELDDWQQDVLQAALGEREDGQWAARQIGLSAPRQNGKSELIVARSLAGVLLFGERTIIVSAHQQDTAREVFDRLVDLIETNPGLASRVAQVHKAVGREYIRFHNRGVIRFKSRASGSGRGFSCDCLLLDEAQILKASAWASMLPTLSARENPQAWLLGTPPPEADDLLLDGQVFSRVRDIGMRGDSTSVAYIEWAAEREDQVDDPAVWAKANPAYGVRIDDDAILAELGSMSAEQFRCERLGVWPLASKVEQVVSSQGWELLFDAGPGRMLAPAALGVSMTREGRISIGACWRWSRAKAEDDIYHVEEVWAGSSVPRAVEWLVLAAGRRIPVLVDEMSPAAQLVPALQANRIKVHKGTVRDVVRGGLLFETMANEGTLSHANQTALTDSVLGGRKRAIGEAGGWGWGARDSSILIHRAVAVTWALLGASNSRAARQSTSDDAGPRKAVFG